MDNTIDAKEEDYLYIHKSQIENSGNGLFTAIKIYLYVVLFTTSYYGLCYSVEKPMFKVSSI